MQRPVPRKTKSNQMKEKIMKKLVKTAIITTAIITISSAAQASSSTYLPDYPQWAQGAFGQK